MENKEKDIGEEIERIKGELDNLIQIREKKKIDEIINKKEDFDKIVDEAQPDYVREENNKDEFIKVVDEAQTTYQSFEDKIISTLKEDEELLRWVVRGATALGILAFGYGISKLLAKKGGN